MIHHGDCLDVLPTLDADSFDACVTDPPYGLEFMGKEWDRLWVGTRAAKAEGWTGSDGVRRNKTQPMSASIKAPIYRAGMEAQAWHEAWAREVYRVLKPGAHLVAMGGTRTYHRLVCAIEDAGFEIRDTLTWLYGSGFPKSKNIGGGWGTALKPACELIVLARKPLSEKSVAANVLRWGTGALNVDGCRIAGTEAQAYTVKRLKPGATLNKTGGNWRPEQGGAEYHGETKAGRWPANVILDEEAASLLDKQSGERPSGAVEKVVGQAQISNWRANEGRTDPHRRGSDYSRGASRFFYTAKADSAERSPNMATRNTHPTVKPISLMAWLVKLVTPPGGLVLDPFLGSGTTALACIGNGVRWEGIEREAEYVAIAEQRIGLGM